MSTQTNIDRDTVSDTIIDRLFEHYKDDSNIRLIYDVNGAKQFTEYVVNLCHKNNIIEFTDAWVDYEKVALEKKHFLEIEVVDLIEDDHNFRHTFRKKLADKLIAYFKQA